MLQLCLILVSVQDVQNCRGSALPEPVIDIVWELDILNTATQWPELRSHLILLLPRNLL